MVHLRGDVVLLTANINNDKNYDLRQTTNYRIKK